MENASYVALSSQLALERQMDMIANNLANQSTTGFKGEFMLFTEYLSSGQGSETVSFVQDAGTARDLRQGPLTKTGNPLDVGLEGQGYLEVDTPAGTRFTRNGHLQLSPNGQIVTSQGYTVLGSTGQPIIVPGGIDQLSISADGTVAAGDATIGQLGVVDFATPQNLVATEEGLYTTDEAPQAPTGVKVMQGMAEESNVRPVIEMTRLLAAARAISNAKAFIDAEADRQKNAVDKLGKTV